MPQYEVVIRIPVDAEDDRAAAAAQVRIFDEIGTHLQQGIPAETYRVHGLNKQNLPVISRFERVNPEQGKGVNQG